MERSPGLSPPAVSIHDDSDVLRQTVKEASLSRFPLVLVFAAYGVLRQPVDSCEIFPPEQALPFPPQVLKKHPSNDLRGLSIPAWHITKCKVAQDGYQYSQDSTDSWLRPLDEASLTATTRHEPWPLPRGLRARRGITQNIHLLL